MYNFLTSEHFLILVTLLPFTCLLKKSKGIDHPYKVALILESILIIAYILEALRKTFTSVKMMVLT